jgi:class 3 adenylate cyclase
VALIVYREFRNLLENAKGISQQIIAINLDIRGFTPFCEGKDSFDVAAYIAKVYMKVIDGYFSDATFYKPTGDGLLIVILCEKNVKVTVNKVIESCLKLVEDFNNFCEGEELIYFPTPDKIGIGIARGSACCIVSEDKIIDYSGKILNLASRLMDIARPSGIVFHSDLGFHFLSEEHKKLFEKDNEVYIRGIAEEKPITIYYTKTLTLISSYARTPIREPIWKNQQFADTLGDCLELKSHGANAACMRLHQEPLDKNQIFVEISFNVGGHRFSYYHDTTRFSSNFMQYRSKGKIHEVTLVLDELIKFLQSHDATEETPIIYSVQYAVKH